ncbi:SDR family NAD(P)-dependent oxidoreductase [Occallatibacter savannae]|uniref:SDR family NAD(P)-dependent oxidoreductase n=1 Tax=Occallatibacter savannae TaxID=1002691 RepID=UPI000D68EB8C|nr:SDR family NAD(P)-dependent oxidoreductase [Occallatibacter savannae]
MQENNGPQRQAAANFPPETGKLAVITCSTNGIGFDIALALARAGADVVLTGRQSPDGHEALARIRPFAPHALVRFEKLDVASLSSVADFANRMMQAGRPVDLLINNANTLVLQNRQQTGEGFELHFATNFLGHFALTARLLPLLRASKQAKVVQLTSTGRHHGEIHVHDLQLQSDYTPLRAYSQSKLAMMIFAVELQRKSDEYGWGITGTSSQPIGTHAAMLANATEVTPSMSWYRRALGLVPNQASAKGGNGVVENLLAKTPEPPAKSLAELIGPPAPEAVDMRVLDRLMGKKVWDLATQLTGVQWPQSHGAGGETVANQAGDGTAS